MKHFVLFFLVSFFIVFNMDVNAQVEQSLNEYKIEQQQKSIDELKAEIKELKKEIDDTKEKKIENEKDNESLDKRISDINGNVDRFGIIVTSLGILTTVLILSFGYFAYRGARNDAKKEAESVTKNWLEKDGKKELDKIIQELQTKSENEFSQLVNERTNELSTLFENFKQEHKEQLYNHENEFKQKMKEQYSVEEKEEIEKDAKISQEKEIKTFDDYWNIVLQYYSNKEYDEILTVIAKAEKLKNLTDKQKGVLYIGKGFIYREQKEYDKAEEYYKKAIDAGNNDALNNLGILYYDQKKYAKAEEYYKKAIDTGEIKILKNLGNLYREQKEYDKAEEYYKKAIDSGDNDALKNLGNLYSEQKEYDEAEEYYKKAIDSGDNDALNSLSWMYFELAKEPKKALELIQKSYDTLKDYYKTHTFAAILLWNEEFTKSYEKFEECMNYEEAMESLKDISEYLNLLIAKGQYSKAKEYFENEKYQLKDKLKPIWYALMTLMRKEFPNEIKKMGSELQESVNDILKTIEELKQKYKI